MASIHVGDVSREGFSVLSQGDARVGYTPLQRARKTVGANHFHYTFTGKVGNKRLLASRGSNELLARGSEKASNQIKSRLLV